ncbi:hypothetical protein [Rhodococcus qingshengii]|uniref:hypothetical protein n=1 Tax=Rhodococcus qingshengii TaxID=334542 RepID=UPI001ADFAB4A|nr:hypothetical protein [Rhodococcus qingshengii]
MNLDENGVLAAAIEHELNNIAALTAARKRGFLPYVKAAAEIGFGSGGASFPSILFGGAALGVEGLGITIARLLDAVGLHLGFRHASPDKCAPGQQADQRLSARDAFDVFFGFGDSRAKTDENPLVEECPPDEKEGEQTSDSLVTQQE